MRHDIRHWITLCETVPGRGYNEILYHGTNEDFADFQISGSKIPALGYGYYFTPSLVKAKQYGRLIMTVRVRCANLLDWNHLTDTDRQRIIADITLQVPADKIAGYGGVAEKVFPPDQIEQTRAFYQAKRDETQNLYHDRAKAKLSQTDDGNFVVSWMEPSLHNASDHDLLALAEVYHNDLARDLGYDGAKFGDEVVVFAADQITILGKTRH